MMQPCVNKGTNELGVTMKPVCLVIGAGAGVGGNVGKRFAAGGYHAV